MTHRLIEAINKGNIKEIEKFFCEKLFNKLSGHKAKLAESILVEAPEVEPASPDEPKSPQIGLDNTPTTKFQPSPAHYRYYFRYQGKMMAVDFVPTNVARTHYSAYVYNRSFAQSDKPFVRMGISNVNQIPELFKKILYIVEKFVEMRKPLTLSFIAGKGLTFPNIVHQHLHDLLKSFSKRPIISKSYSVSRGGNNSAAFELKRGAATQTNIKSKGWHPASTKPMIQKDDEPTTEEIANVTGGEVATDVPFKQSQRIISTEIKRKPLIKKSKYTTD